MTFRDENGREVAPGEWIAIQHGCGCTVRDGEAVDNERWPDWLVKGCPLHDPDADPENPQPGSVEGQ